MILWVNNRLDETPYLFFTKEMFISWRVIEVTILSSADCDKTGWLKIFTYMYSVFKKRKKK